MGAQAFRSRGMAELMPRPSVADASRRSSLHVEPFSVIPRSGIVAQGMSEIDESAITGSVFPVVKHPGDSVHAGSRNGAAPLYITPQDKEPQAEPDRDRPETGNLFDRLFGPFLRFWMRKLTICALAAFLAGVTWMVMQRHQLSPLGIFYLLIGLLPPGLFLVWPVQWFVARRWLARQGMVCRNAFRLARLRYKAGIVFGRAGTLSLGQLRVVSLQPAGATVAAELITLAASAYQTIEDVWGKAILAFGISHRIRLRPSEEVLVEPGAGLWATIGGQRIAIGRRDWIEGQGIDTTLLADAIAEHERLGRLMLIAAIVAPEPECLGVLAFADPPKAGAVELLRLCKRSGIETILIAGPSEKATTVLAGLLGVDRVIDAARALAELDAQAVIAVGRSNDRALLTRVEDAIAIGDAAVAQNPDTAFGSRREDPRHVLDFIILSQTLARRLPLALLIVWMTGWPVAATGLGLIRLPFAAIAICLGAGIVIAILQALLLQLLGSLANDGTDD